MEDLPKPKGHRRLPDALLHGDHKCENCHKPGANMICASCQISDIGSICTRYCSRDCQKEHWQEHKKVCRDRRRLARATRLYDTIWTTFAENTFVSRFTLDGKTDGIVKVRPIYKKETLYHGGWTGETIFRDFPKAVMGDNEDDEIKQALLHESACDDVLSTGLGLVQSLLFQVCSKITEIHIKTKDRPIEVEIEGFTTVDWDHTVLRARLESGEEFAIDLTGAQFGWQEKIYTWQSYIQHRAECLDGPAMALGHAHMHQALDMTKYPTEILRRAAYEYREEIAQGVGKSITAFFNEKETSAWKFLSQAESTFPAQSAELVAKATMTIHDGIHKLTVERGLGRWYVHLDPCDYGLKVLRDELLACKMKKIWMSKKRVDKVFLRFAHLPKPAMERACLDRLTDILEKRWALYMCCNDV
ncbi:unnamed protein product [Clonostachys rosea]|uniref:MYND-type domain-containing protein n=1 Tax=Bionectria ochroleuca TaxID=29856 RepID=A0ABY6V4Q5_BIOOC|nr:unnamed protein product [Clonostachys rosea]